MGDSSSWNSLHQELKMKILSHLPDEDLARFAAVDREAMGMAADVMTMKWSEWATQAIEYVQRTYNMELHQVRDIVFRGDARSPDVIFRIGFTPHPDYIDAPILPGRWGGHQPRRFHKPRYHEGQRGISIPRRIYLRAVLQGRI
jgi:hypothetical protein